MGTLPFQVDGLMPLVSPPLSCTPLFMRPGVLIGAAVLLVGAVAAVGALAGATIFLSERRGKTQR